jgi:predicted RNase H-like nuclease (RuvC/YqgF family)
LLWIYLRLLSSRQAFARLLSESSRVDGGAEPLERRIQGLKRTLDEPPPETEELRKSLLSQVDILQLRLNTQREAVDKLAYLDAELARIEQQVELIREQAVVSTDPSAVSQRIDSIAATLSGTTQWIRDQRQVYGQLDDVLEETPVLVVEPVRQG